MAGTHAHYHPDGGGAATVEVGCGLTGDGTPGDPVAAAPAAGEEAWPWTLCTAPDGSTLKCDPATGELWTPPEHDFATYPQQDAGVGPPGPFGPTGGPTRRVTTFITVTAGALGDCRWWNGRLGAHGTFDITYTADAEFRVGFLVSEDGGPDEFIPVGGILDTGGNAGRQLLGGNFHRGVFREADQALQWSIAFAIDVVAGQITINDGSWTPFRIVGTERFVL